MPQAFSNIGPEFLAEIAHAGKPDRHGSRREFPAGADGFGSPGLCDERGAEVGDDGTVSRHVSASLAADDEGASGGVTGAPPYAFGVRPEVARVFVVERADTEGEVLPNCRAGEVVRGALRIAAEALSPAGGVVFRVIDGGARRYQQQRRRIEDLMQGPEIALAEGERNIRLRHVLNGFGRVDSGIRNEILPV